jgi:hypothetical protein
MLRKKLTVVFSETHIEHKNTLQAEYAESCSVIACGTTSVHCPWQSNVGEHWTSTTGKALAPLRTFISQYHLFATRGVWHVPLLLKLPSLQPSQRVLIVTDELSSGSLQLFMITCSQQANCFVCCLLHATFCLGLLFSPEYVDISTETSVDFHRRTRGCVAFVTSAVRTWNPKKFQVVSLIFVLWRRRNLDLIRD